MQRLNFTTINVNSSWIRGIDYHGGVLTIDTGRSLYAFNGVPSSIALEFATADSHGEYFNSYIRDTYEFIELQ